MDQDGIDEAEGNSESPADDEPDHPVAATKGLKAVDGDVLDNGCRNGEGDVYSTCDQDHEKTDGPDQVDCVVVEERRQVSEGQELVRSEGQAENHEAKHHQQSGLN